jgi:hypothetical protein
MSFKYDPRRRIDPDRWLAHSEAERIEAATSYHRMRALGGPNLVAHATFHVVVENQVALGAATPVQATLARLMDEGLDRHDAVHAIGSVLASHVYDLLKAPEERTDPNTAYYAELNKLTAATWRAGLIQV